MFLTKNLPFKAALSLLTFSTVVFSKLKASKNSNFNTIGNIHGNNKVVYDDCINMKQTKMNDGSVISVRPIMSILILSCTYIISFRD